MRHLIIVLMFSCLVRPALAQPEEATHEPDAEVIPASARVLRESPDFRLRVQAAFALGAGGDGGMRLYLERALLDAHPSVRSSAAAALARLGTVESLVVLRQVVRQERSPLVRAEAQEAIGALSAVAERQTRADVRGEEAIAGRHIPWRRVRKVFLISEVSNDGRLRGERVDQAVTRELIRFFTTVPDVAVLDVARPLHRRATVHIRRRRIAPIRVDVTVTRLRAVRRGESLRVDCAISIVLQDARGGAVRGVIQGRASSEATRVRQGEAAQRLRLAEQAAAGAVESALSDIERIMGSLTTPS